MGRRHRESRGRHSSGTPRATARAVTPRPAYEHHSSSGPLTDAASIADPRREGDTAGQGDVVPAVTVDDGPAAPVAQTTLTDSTGSTGPTGSNGFADEAIADPLDSVRPSATNAGSVGRSGATTAQLRRFIKSRPYVPLHELRRRFVLNGHDDDVVRLEIDGHCVWVGLPPDEGRMLADLLRQGEVGCELSLDPDSPVVVGVFPIRPMVIPRPGRPTSTATDGP